MKFHLTQLTLLVLLPLTVLSQTFENTTRTFYTRTHHLSGNKAFANLYRAPAPPRPLRFRS